MSITSHILQTMMNAAQAKETSIRAIRVSLDSLAIKETMVELSDEQKEFVDLVAKQRRSMFLCGSGGYGKSATIDATVEAINGHVQPKEAIWFIRKYRMSASNAEIMRLLPVVAVCASTGKAASLLTNARTLHSYFGIGIARGEPEDWARRLTTAKYLRATRCRLLSVQVIIIDEISMISAQLLDKIDRYLRIVRDEIDEPFGGVQMVLVGDMAQLPPVQGDYVFKSNAFASAGFGTHYLTKCFRQSDPEFLKILGEVRAGECSSESYERLMQLSHIDPEYSEGMKPLRIMATNAEVDKVNEMELRNVCAQNSITPVDFPIRHISLNEKRNDAFRKADGIPESVQLAIGTQVVVTHNISRSIVNGSQGTIIGIGLDEVQVRLLGISESVKIGYVGYKDPEHNDEYEASVIFEYMPLRLAYASTVHKIQGSTLRLVQVDAARIFAHGQMYCALSRCTDMRGLMITGLNPKCIKCDPVIKRFLKL